MSPKRVDFREKCNCINRLAALIAALDERGRRGPTGVREDARLPTGDGPRLQPPIRQNCNLLEPLGSTQDITPLTLRDDGQNGPPLLLTPVEAAALRRNRHREERSDVAIRESSSALRSLDRFAIARPEDGRLSTPLGSKPNRRVAASFREGGE